MSYETNKEHFRRKSNQEWEMAGLARRDGDKADEIRHTAEARRYDQLAREA
jgi:hypothetical protein